MAVNRVPVTIGGRVFNVDTQWYCDTLEGWEQTAPLDLVLTAYGTADGSRLGARTRSKEQPVTAGGAVLGASSAERDLLKRQLLALFSPDSEIVVQREGEQMYLVLADAIGTDLVTPRGFRWTAPLIALDPFKYALLPVVADAGAFSGTPYYRPYLHQRVSNGKFETDLSGWVQGGGNPLPSRSTTQAFEGVASMRLSAPGGGVYSQANLTTPNRFAVTPGEKLRVSAQVRADTTSRAAQVQIAFYDASGTFISFGGPAVANAVSTGWTLAQTTITVPAAATAGEVQVLVAPGVAGELYYFDDVSVTSDAFSDFSLPPANRLYSAVTFGRTYTSQGIALSYPEAAQLNNAGDATSRRVTLTIFGPLNSGDYAIANETTGDQLVPLVNVAAGSTLVIDCYRRSAFIGNVDVTEAMFGEWISLAPGSNTLRLNTGTSNSTAHMSVSALSASR